MEIPDKVFYDQIGVYIGTALGFPADAVQQAVDGILFRESSTYDRNTYDRQVRKEKPERGVRTLDDSINYPELHSVFVTQVISAVEARKGRYTINLPEVMKDVAEGVYNLESRVGYGCKRDPSTGCVAPPNRRGL